MPHKLLIVDDFMKIQEHIKNILLNYNRVLILTGYVKEALHTEDNRWK